MTQDTSTVEQARELLHAQLQGFRYEPTEATEAIYGAALRAIAAKPVASPDAPTPLPANWAIKESERLADEKLRLLRQKLRLLRQAFDRRASPSASPDAGLADRAEQLMQAFYLSDAYDPHATRPADKVKAAILFALSSPRPVDEVRRQGQKEGFAAAVAWLRDRSAMKPRPALWHAASMLADQLEQSRQALASLDDQAR